LTGTMPPGGEDQRLPDWINGSPLCHISLLRKRYDTFATARRTLARKASREACVLRFMS
jgi:hypothetical protein